MPPWFNEQTSEDECGASPPGSRPGPHHLRPGDISELSIATNINFTNVVPSTGTGVVVVVTSTGNRAIVVSAGNRAIVVSTVVPGIVSAVVSTVVAIRTTRS